jgi:hypothetical protein
MSTHTNSYLLFSTPMNEEDESHERKMRSGCARRADGVYGALLG